jgi:hypothetical protein
MYVQSLLKVLILREDYPSEKNMKTTDQLSENVNPSETNTLEHFTLIDLLLVIVDNLRLLVIGPVVVGSIIFVITTIMPKTYESTAILKVKAEQVTASLIHSAAVLDPIVKSLGYTHGMPLDDARLKLKEQIQARFSPKDKLLTVTTKAHTPQASQALNLSVLQQVYAQSKPRDSEKMRLEKQLNQAKDREKEASQSAQLMGLKLGSSGNAGASEVAQGYAQMMRIVQESQLEQFTAEQQLNGLDASALVQESTLPYKHVEPKRWLITVLAAQVAAFFCLFGSLSATRSETQNATSIRLRNWKF